MINQLDLLHDLRLLFSEQGLRDFIHSFMNISEEQKIVFNLTYNQNEFRWEGEYEDEVTCITSKIIRSLYADFEKIFSKQVEFILKALDNAMVVYKDEPEPLNNLFDRTAKELRDIRANLRAEPFICRYRNQIQILLLNLEGEVLNRLDNVQKKMLSKKTNGSANSQKKKGFGFKGSKELLEKIYYKCGTKEDKFISPETDINDFVDILTSKEVIKTEKKIYLECNTKEAVYILDKLERYFKNLNPASIQESQFFLTKDGNHLSDDNIYTTRNAFRTGKTHIKDKIYIDSFFEDLDKSLKKNSMRLRNSKSS